MNFPATPPSEWPAGKSVPEATSASDVPVRRLGGLSDEAIMSTLIVVVGTIAAGVVAMAVAFGGLTLLIEEQSGGDAEGYGLAVVAVFFFVLLCIIPLAFAVLVGWRVRRHNSPAKVWPTLVVGVASLPAAVFAVWASSAWGASSGFAPLGWIAAVAVVVAYVGWLFAVVARLSIRRAVLTTVVAIGLVGVVGLAGALNDGG